MAMLFGERLSKRQIYERVGNLSQICGTRVYTLADAKAKGVSAVDIRSGGGLCYTVLPDRGMDIVWADYKGIPLSFISKSGITAPEYYCSEKGTWGQNFYGGLLTTCGLMQVGSGCVYDCRKYGPHGDISNIPAENIGIIRYWEDDELIMGVSGCLSEALLYRENLQMTRTITSKLGQNIIFIHDVIENNGFERIPLMMLYHINLGYPFVGKDTVMVTQSAKIMPAENTPEEEVEKYNEFAEPESGYQSRVFHHDLIPENSGRVCCKLINNRLGIEVCIKFNKNELWNFTEWKHLAAGDYVVGLEPCNNFGLGISNEEKNGSLEYIEPGEKREFNLEIGIANS